MQWSDVTTPPSPRALRQFAGLWLVFFGLMSGWRIWHGRTGGVTGALAVLAVVVGVTGLVRPAAIRVVYTGSMAAAYPIGWTVSRVMLGMLFYLLVTLVACVFRLAGRDALRRRRTRTESYWAACAAPRKSAEYFRQF